MIPRYSRKEISEIWSDLGRFKIWLEVELKVTEELEKIGMVPTGTAEKIRAKATIDPIRIAEIEAETKHDVISFVSQIVEVASPEAGYLHRGMTSNDLVDTAFALQLTRSGAIILSGIDTLAEEIKKRAYEHKDTATVGRTHGIHAEPTTLGIKFASWFAELKRARARLVNAIEDIKVGKIAGAVGTYSGLPPEVELSVLSSLGLRPETVPSQVVHRDRHAYFFSCLALLASSIERFAVEIRHLQRTEVREIEEPFSLGQKGSSAMPHKRNPILTENLCGLARLVRGYSDAAMENVALWHERDISHSSVERVIAPDACIVVDFMLHRFTTVVKGMVIYPDQIKRNIDLTRGLVFSGSLLTILVDHGVGRDDAYKLVQQHALAAWDGGPNLEQRVRADSRITEKLSSSVLDEVFDISRHVKHVDTIFARTFDTGGK